MWEKKGTVKGGTILRHSVSGRWVVAADRYGCTFHPSGSDGQCSKKAALANWRALHHWRYSK